MEGEDISVPRPGFLACLLPPEEEAEGRQGVGMPLPMIVPQPNSWRGGSRVGGGGGGRGCPLSDGGEPFLHDS